jgi:hypothetical protein
VSDEEVLTVGDSDHYVVPSWVRGIALYLGEVL